MSMRKLCLAISIYLYFAANAIAGALLQEINGRDISAAELEGKWVFINYWASWCRPCLDEIPELNRFYEENKDNNIAVFAVNYEAIPLNQQQRLIKKLDIRYPSLKDDPAPILQLGDIRGVPVTFVINPQGQLITALYGGQSINSLNAVIAKN